MVCSASRYGRSKMQVRPAARQARKEVRRERIRIAEELAFRGFLLRRLISADFESVSLRAFTAISFVVSSVAFGLLHGDRWLAGAVAGAVYAGVLLWRGRIGDAVVAHGVSNALIAVWVLALGNWQLW